MGGEKVCIGVRRARARALQVLLGGHPHALGWWPAAEAERALEERARPAQQHPLLPPHCSSPPAIRIAPPPIAPPSPAPTHLLCM
jgi:hypothetical protein